METPGLTPPCSPPPGLCFLSATLFYFFFYNLSAALRTLLWPEIANDWHHTHTESLISPTVSLQNYIPGYGSGNQPHALSLNKQSPLTQLALNFAFLLSHSTGNPKGGWALK